jgi:ABC-type nitrate/sulfonate/bicarbonate transport system permease component
VVATSLKANSVARVAFDAAVQSFMEQSVLSMIPLVILTFGLAHPKLVPSEKVCERDAAGRR